MPLPPESTKENVLPPGAVVSLEAKLPSAPGEGLAAEHMLEAVLRGEAGLGALKDMAEGVQGRVGGTRGHVMADRRREETSNSGPPLVPPVRVPAIEKETEQGELIPKRTFSGAVKTKFREYVGRVGEEGDYPAFQPVQQVFPVDRERSFELFLELALKSLLDTLARHLVLNDVARGGVLPSPEGLDARI